MTPQRLVAAALALALVSSGPAAAQKKDHVDFYKQGLEALEQSKLNDAEKAEMEKARVEMQKRGGSGGGVNREEMLKRFDKDGDGKLSDAEKKEAKDAYIQKKRNHRRAKDGGT